MTVFALMAAALIAHPDNGSSTMPKGAPPPSPLSRRIRPYDVRHYRLELDTRRAPELSGRVEVTLAPSRPLRSVELDSLVQVEEVTVEGQKVSFAVRDAVEGMDALSILPRAPLKAGVPVRIAIRYRFTAGTAHQGAFLAPDPLRPTARPALFTQLQPNSARRVFPANDVPDDKATTEVILLSAPSDVALSNGRLLEDAVVELEGARVRRTHWTMETPHSPYLVAFAVGPFETVELEGTTTPAALHVLPGRLDRLTTTAKATKAALEHQERFLGMPYPWPRYDQVGIPGFFWGGMENTTLTTLRESRMLDTEGSVVHLPSTTGLVQHELAHQWFGDLVTCRTWGDTWLNEGFATWLAWHSNGAYWSQELSDVSRASSLLRSYFREEDGPRSHPLVTGDAASAEDVFDATSYQKGGQVLWMLQEFVGLEAMRSGLRHYLVKHKYGNASSQDFFRAMAESTRKPLAAFEKAWTLQRGYPVLTPAWKWNGRRVTLTVTQRPNHASEKGVFVFKLPVVLERKSAPAYRKEVILTMDRRTVSTTVEVPAPPEWVNWNRGLAALARVDLRAVPESEWIAGAAGAADPVWRVQALYALSEAYAPVPRVHAPSAEAVNALVKALSDEPSAHVKYALLQRLDESPRELPPMAPLLEKLAGDETLTSMEGMRVRKAALELLGLSGTTHGLDVKYPQALLQSADLPLDLVEGAAIAVARAGQLDALSAALTLHGPRGPLHLRAISDAYGVARGPNAAAAILERFRASGTDSELSRGLISKLKDNRALLQTADGARLVETIVLGDNPFGDDLRARALRLLDEVDTPPANATLTRISETARSEWLRRSAAQVLARRAAR